MLTTEELVQRIEAHCAATGTAETTFGKMVVNDGKLVKRLRRGGSLRMDTYSKIMAAISLDEGAAA